MERGAAGVAAMHEPCAARRPEAYLHVELSPRGGGLHHPVHHTDQGFALAHLRQTGKESSEVSRDGLACCGARVPSEQRGGSVQEPSGHRAARCHPQEMSQELKPQGDGFPGAAAPPFCAVKSVLGWLHALKTLLRGRHR